MLSGKDDHRLIEHAHIIQTAFFGAFPFVMDDACAGKIIIFITGLNDAVRKIDVFSVHKIGFIQQACFIQHFFTDEHEGTGQYIHFVGFILIEMT